MLVTTSILSFMLKEPKSAIADENDDDVSILVCRTYNPVIKILHKHHVETKIALDMQCKFHKNCTSTTWVFVLNIFFFYLTIQIQIFIEIYNTYIILFLLVTILCQIEIFLFDFVLIRNKYRNLSRIKIILVLRESSS